MNSRSQMACAGIGVFSVVSILVGFVVADYIPPPKASWSAPHLAHFYASHTDRTRIGIFILLVGLAGFSTLLAAISIIMRKIEGANPTLSLVQVVAGAAGYTCLLLFVLLLAAAAFRPGRNPDVTQALHDCGWFMAFLAITPFMTQAICIAAAVLGDKSDNPLLPRWYGYFNAWIAALLFPGGFLMFFKHGLLSYQGVLGYWVPLFGFGGWMLGMAWAIREAALRDARAAA